MSETWWKDWEKEHLFVVGFFFFFPFSTWKNNKMKYKLLQKGYSDMDIIILVTSSLWDSVCDTFGCKAFNDPGI